MINTAIIEIATYVTLTLVIGVPVLSLYTDTISNKIKKSHIITFIILLSIIFVQFGWYVGYEISSNTKNNDFYIIHPKTSVIIEDNINATDNSVQPIDNVHIWVCGTIH